MDQVIEYVIVFINVYLLCLFVWVLLSWLPQISPGLAYNEFVGGARRFLDSIILPFVKLFSFIKPVQIGGMLLDLSVLAAMFSLIILQKVLISV